MRHLMVSASVVLLFSLGPGSTLASEEEPPATGAFSATGSLADARFGHTATVLTDGRVLVVGGLSSMSEGATPPEVWDPATGTFSATGSLADARFGHTATVLTDGRVLVAGGMGEGGALASAEIWDPATGAFTSTGSLLEGRLGHTATVLRDGRVLIVGSGGIVSSGGGKYLASAEVWDPTTGAFSPAGSLAEQRATHTATLMPDGHVLIVGGADDDSHLASAEIWDPATGSFEPAGSLAQERALHTAVLLPDGRVLVFGGHALKGRPASAEMWDPATGSFEPAGSLAQERALHTAVLLPDGRVLVFGREDAGVWDPLTDSFGPTGALVEPRGWHSTTLLSDGRVLVVGGTGEDDVLASAEVWDPATSIRVPAVPAEMPTAGPKDFAVTFPDDWIVEEMSPDDDAWPTSALDPETRSLLTPVLRGHPGSMHDWCVVVDFTRLVRSEPDWTSLDDVIEGFMLLMKGDSRWESLESTFMDLPAGRTGRIVRSVRDEARRVSTYYFTDSDAWFYLECVSGRSSGRWRSVAKTFEFLPAKEND